MPVSVSLESLVSIGGTRPVWPEQFRELVLALEAAPEDKTLWGALGDWCEEQGEHGMSRALRWVAKREHVGAENSRPPGFGNRPYWKFINGIPSGLAVIWVQSTDRTTLAGLVAELAAALRRLDEEPA